MIGEYWSRDLAKTHHKDPDDGADGLVLLDESVELRHPGSVVVQNLFTREFWKRARIFKHNKTNPNTVLKFWKIDDQSQLLCINYVYKVHRK